jgi:hypothetical protein
MQQTIKGGAFALGLIFLAYGFFGDMHDITETNVRLFLVSSAFYLAIGRWWKD